MEETKGSQNNKDVSSICCCDVLRVRARRRLFPGKPIDTDLVARTLKDVLRDMALAKRERWGSDFELNQPLESGVHKLVRTEPATEDTYTLLSDGESDYSGNSEVSSSPVPGIGTIRFPRQKTIEGFTLTRKLSSTSDSGKKRKSLPNEETAASPPHLKKGKLFA